MRYLIVAVLVFFLCSQFVQAKSDIDLTHGKDWITGVAFSAKGKRLYSSSFDGTIVAWNVETKKPMWKIDLDALRETQDYSTITHFSEMDLSPNEKVLAVTTSQTKVTKKLVNGKIQTTGSKPSYSIMLFDTLNGKSIGNLTEFEYKINAVDFSPDGNQIVSASGDKEVKVWDIQTRKQVLTIPLTNAGRIAIFSPDGKTIAVSTVKLTYRDEDEINIGLYDAKTGKLIRSIPRSHSSAGEIDFSPDGRYLAVASNGKSLALQIKKVDKNQAEIRFGDTDTGQGQVDIWEIDKISEKPIAVFTGQGADTVRFMTNQFLIYSTPPNIQIMDTKTNKEVRKLNFGNTILSMTISDDNRYLAVSGKKGKIKIYNLN